MGGKKISRNSDGSLSLPEVGRRGVLVFGATATLGGIVFSCASDGDGSGGTAGTAGSSASAGTGGLSGTGAGGSSTAAGSGGTQATAGATSAGETGAGAGGGAADVPWATGGTVAMTDKASYPNPFTDLPSACNVTCALTEGPCYSADSVEIQDISYGRSGLPLRLYLRILDDACKPVAGATVDLWHCGPEGVYSGNDSAHEDVAFCTGNDADFESHLYFRGKQTTNADGIVYFDTCFPGWYSSRTIHIHMTISVGSDAYVTTQFGFDDTLDDSIVAGEPIYKDRGARDTSNTTDTVLPADDVADYVFETQKMTDGAMLGWKTIILRSSLDDAICSPSGAGGPPGGGPPNGQPPPN
jgi:protocatechuate 3,4-dioxygenase beta subunit